MYEKILELTIRVNADITLSDSAKKEISMLLDICSTEKDLSQIENALNLYWWSTESIVNEAMWRKTYEELKDINHTLLQMVSGSQNIVEKSLRHHDGNEAQSLLSSF